MKLGGPADVLTTVENSDELAAAVEMAENAGVPWFILGGGSNILVGDLGVRGLVIKNEAEGITLEAPESGATGGQFPRKKSSPPLDVSRYSCLIAESGVKMAKLSAFANEKGLAGLEMFLSVPGTVGGAIYNNSHFRPSNNEFIGNLVESADIMMVSTSEPRLDNISSTRSARNPRSLLRMRIVDGEWFKFGYDYSRLQDERAVVLTVTFKLKRGDPDALQARSMELLKQRNQHQPIGLPSCGCMFKNPNGRSAGKLIDEAGLKGIGVGGISVSRVHANFMVNDGTGTVSDVLELMARVKKGVKEKFGVELKPEIFFVGEFTSSRFARDDECNICLNL